MKIKQILSGFIILCVICFSIVCFPLTLNTSAATGNWSSYTEKPAIENGTIFIKNAKQLSWFNENKNNSSYRTNNVKLMSDIDLSSHYWVPKAQDGTWANNWGNAIFDGGYYKIIGLTINSANSSKTAGLFSYIYYGATIKNINFVNCSITGTHSRAGILAGYIDGTSVSNCTFTNCSINASECTDYGGVVGFANASTITQCYMFDLSIVANGDTCRVGGIVGYQYNTNVTVCCTYLTGSGISVTGTSAYVGGICGQLQDTNTSDSITYKIEKCYCTGSVGISCGTEDSYSAYGGGICGYLCTNGLISSCFNAVSVSSNAKSQKGKQTTFDTNLINDASSVRCDIYKKAWAPNVYICRGTRTDSGANGDYKGKSYQSYSYPYNIYAYAGGIAGYAEDSSSVGLVYNTGAIDSNGRSYTEYQLYFKYFEEGLFGGHHYDFEPATLTARGGFKYYKGNIIGFRSSSSSTCSTSYCYAEEEINSINNCWKSALDTPKGVSYYGGEGSPYSEMKQGARFNYSNNSILEVYCYMSVARNDETTQVVYSKQLAVDSSYTNEIVSTNLNNLITVNSNVWAVDSKINGGKPFIRDFYWEYSAVKPS